MSDLDFDKETLEELKIAYEIARKEHKTSFSFKNHLLWTSYAKYLIEYLTNKFKENEEIDII